MKAPKDLSLAGRRILMVAPCLGKFGGIEAFCLALAEDLLRKDAEVTILRKKVAGFAPNGSIENAEAELLAGHPEEHADRFASAYLPRLSLRLLREIGKAHLVHVHNALFEVVSASRLTGKPCVATIYNWRRRNLSPRTLAWNAAASLADRRWYISEFVWDSWEPRRRRPGSARLPVVSRMPAGHHPPDKRKGFLFLGRWIPNKGLRILLQAYASLDLDPKTWPLTLAGDGPLRPEVELFLRDHPLPGVRLAGFVSDEERHRLTREAKWMVTPPHTNEDLGLTPLEARAVSVPCIVSEDGGLKETGGPHAIRCRPGEVKDLARVMLQAARMNEEQYLRHSALAKEGLEDYVRPLHDYAREYLRLLAS